MSPSQPSPAATPSERMPFALPEASLDVITVIANEVSFLNRRRDNTELPAHAHSGLRVFWHLEAGLISSPNVTRLPSHAPDVGGSNDAHTDPTPKVMTDSDIYRIFQPRYVRNSGDLFGRLNLSREVLWQHIILIRSTIPYGGRYILSTPVIESWARLEDALIDVATTLLAAIPGLPSLAYPKFPWGYGYRDAHRTADLTLRCAFRAREAFVDLSSLVSFAISLHMYPGTGPTTAFKLVQERSKYRPTRAWFDLLAESYVCNFVPDFRVGGLINPYTTRWSHYIEKFTTAQVPIWIFWGHAHNTTPPADASALAYLPSSDEIRIARLAAEATFSLVLPQARYYPSSSIRAPAHLYSAGAQGLSAPPQRQIPTYNPPAAGSFSPSMSHFDDDYPMGMSEHAISPQWQPSNSPVRDSPLSPSPRPETPPLVPLRSSEEEAAREANALAALEQYFSSQERARERRLANEEPRERLQRESWEQLAEKTLLFTAKSPVYEWRKLPDGTYERVKLASSEVQYTWENFTRNQRRFIGHINSWELCPQLPKYSDRFTEETEPDSDDDDDDDDNIYPMPPPRSADDKLYANDIQALTQMQPVDDEPTVPRVENNDFAVFMKLRFGYDIDSPAGWTTDIEPSREAKDISFMHAKKVLAFDNVPSGPHVPDAVVNFVKILSNHTWTFSHLPPAFDHTNDRGISLKSDTLQIILIGDDDSTKYLICNKGFIDESPWGILVDHASTVLFAFRARYTTITDIARQLMILGTPYHTVQAAEADSIPKRDEPVRGLGTRPQNYQPTREDYEEYLRRRRDLLLTGSKGRAALMHGGIVARIARQVLGYHTHTILDGPSESAVTITSYGRFNLYDDALTENDTSVICGVYYIDVESQSNQQVPSTANFSEGTKSHLSFWPKDTTWNSASAFLTVEWTEDAETFYQNRLIHIDETLYPKDDVRVKRPFKLLSATGWRSALRRKNTLSKQIEVGTEHYQAGYLEDFLRRS